MPAEHEGVRIAEETSGVAAIRIHRAGRDRAVVIDVLGRIVPARRFGAAGAAVGAGVAEQRQGVGQRHRVERGNTVELEGVGAADGQCTILSVADAAPELTVEGLAAAAAVGVGSLLVVSLTRVLDERATAVGKSAFQRIDAGIKASNGFPVATQWFFDFDADEGLLKSTVLNRRDRLSGIVAGCREGRVFEARKDTPEWAAVGLGGETQVERA